MSDLRHLRTTATRRRCFLETGCSLMPSVNHLQAHMKRMGLLEGVRSTSRNWPRSSPRTGRSAAMVELIEQSRMACDRLIDVTGRAVLQGVLQLCAAQVAEVCRSRANALGKRGLLWPASGAVDAQRPQYPVGRPGCSPSARAAAKKSRFPSTPLCRTSRSRREHAGYAVAWRFGGIR